jgi:hypothetical protein
MAETWLYLHHRLSEAVPRRAEGGVIVSGQIMFLLARRTWTGTAPSGADFPAEVSGRFVMNSSDGPLESVMIRCPSGHCFNGPIEFLAFEKPARAAGLCHVKLPVIGAERAVGGTSGSSAWRSRWEFAGPARYPALADETGQGAVCG